MTSKYLPLVEVKGGSYTMILVNNPGDDALCYLLENTKIPEELVKELENPWDGEEFKNGIRILDPDIDYMTPKLYNYMHSVDAIRMDTCKFPVTITITRMCTYEWPREISGETKDGTKTSFYDYCCRRGIPW
jgi:hypothetical protein